MAEIKTVYKGDMLFETTINGHTLTIDVPESMGGSNRGVTPPQVFIASLSSCIGAFAASYCNEHGINTEGMTVSVSFEKVSDPTRLVNIKAHVELPNGEVGKRGTAVKRAALHCPVHETIKAFEGIAFEFVDKNGSV
ncbi:MAG: OsmC family protein [Anaerolineae bacterium]|nr:OsmC family protein [Anaerolineae bacterium]